MAKSKEKQKNAQRGGVAESPPVPPRTTNSWWPSPNQWDRWSLPSKYTAVGLAIGFFFGIVSCVLTVVFYYLPKHDEELKTAQVAKVVSLELCHNAEVLKRKADFVQYEWDALKRVEEAVRTHPDLVQTFAYEGVGERLTRVPTFAFQMQTLSSQSASPPFAAYAEIYDRYHSVEEVERLIATQMQALSRPGEEMQKRFRVRIQVEMPEFGKNFSRLMNMYTNTAAAVREQLHAIGCDNPSGVAGSK